MSFSRLSSWFSLNSERSREPSLSHSSRSVGESQTSNASSDSFARPGIRHSRAQSESRISIFSSLAKRLPKLRRSNSCPEAVLCKSSAASVHNSSMRDALSSLQTLLQEWHEPLRVEEGKYSSEFKAQQSACARLKRLEMNILKRGGDRVGNQRFKHVQSPSAQEEKSRSTVFARDWLSLTRSRFPRTRRVRPSRHDVAVVHQVLKKFAGEHSIYDKYVELAAILKERLADPEERKAWLAQRPEAGLHDKADVRECLYQVALKIEEESEYCLNVLANYDAAEMSAFVRQVIAWGEQLKQLQTSLSEACAERRLDISSEIARPRSLSRLTRSSVPSLSVSEFKESHRKLFELYYQELNRDKKSQHRIDQLIERAESRQRQRLLMDPDNSIPWISLAQLTEEPAALGIWEQPDSLRKDNPSVADLFIQAYNSADQLARRGKIGEAAKLWKAEKA